MPGAALPALSAADSADARTFVGFFVSAGLVNAAIAAILLCRLPDSPSPSLLALLARAAFYVLVSAAAGVAGAYLYWRRSAISLRASVPISFADFSRTCAAGWVWLPAAVLLSSQDSRATAIIGLLCGAALGAGLRKGIALPESPGRQPAFARDREMFAATLERVPPEPQGYLIASCVYAAAYAQHDGARLVAALLGGTGAFLFAWNWSQPARNPGQRSSRDAGWRLARASGLAILFTAWALLLGVAHRNASGNAAFAADAGNARDSNAHRGKKGEVVSGPGGFESVILWPFPPKRQIIPPLPEPRNFLGPDRSRPMVIRFDGAYWYFQPPDTGPGRTAHQAHGSPLSVNIQSSNEFPLIMEAHQPLIGPVRLSRCAEIDVEIQNRDNLQGVVSLALMLGDSAFPNKPPLYLGKKVIETTMAGFFSYKAAPVLETLRFAIPRTAELRKFDQITVMLLPEIEHSMVGAKIAIQQFELQPR